MGRRSGPPKERKHVHLTEGAWAELEIIYGPQNITPSSVIAKLVDHHLRRIKERAAQKLDKVRTTDIHDDDTELVSDFNVN